MRNRISSKTKEKFRKSIRNVLKGFSRKIIVYKQPIKNECPNCYFDKLTGNSTGKCKWTLEEALQKQASWEILNPNQTHYRWFNNGRCPICRGQGYLTVERKTYVDCVVTWDPSRSYSNTMTYTPAGAEGSTVVILKTNPQYYDLFKNSTSLVIDGIECKMSKAPILRGLGTQAVLIITAFTTDKPKIDSGEIIKEYI